MTKGEIDDIEYQFKVIYTLDSASKGKSHIQFLHPDSEEGKSVKNVLQKYKVSDELYPHKPKTAAELVRIASGQPFNSHDHTEAWKRHKVRPKSGNKSPGNTNSKYCIYHLAHKDYTYSDKWVTLLVDEIAKNVETAKTKATEAAVKAAEVATDA